MAFVDCDDELEPGALAAVRNCLLAHPEIDYVFTDRIDIDEKGRVIRTATYGGYEGIRFSGQDNIRSDLLDGMVASHLKVIRRSAYLEIGGCDAMLAGVRRLGTGPENVGEVSLALLGHSAISAPCA